MPTELYKVLARLPQSEHGVFVLFRFVCQLAFILCHYHFARPFQNLVPLSARPGVACLTNYCPFGTLFPCPTPQTSRAEQPIQVEIFGTERRQSGMLKHQISVVPISSSPLKYNMDRCFRLLGLLVPISCCPETLLRHPIRWLDVIK